MLQSVVSSDGDEVKALIVSIGDHYFGAIIDNIEDVIQRQPTTPVPLAPDHIIGLLNLRGHIVTEIDVAKTLEIERSSFDGAANDAGYSMVVNHKGEMYSLVFDDVGDVVDIAKDNIESLPNTINKKWFLVSPGVYRMGGRLVVLLDFDLLIDHITPQNSEIV